MIVLLANRWNPAAEALRDRWTAHGVGLLTPADLSTHGWMQHLDDPHAGTAIVGGHPVPQSDLTAVLPLLPCVFEQELTSIVPEDRTYVAAEMTAFLLSWLTRLPCRVLNRPSPPCLAGPFWRPERWTHLAAQLGIPVRRLHRTCSPISGEPSTLPTSITVIGPETFGEAHPTLHRHALTLARSAQVDLLEVLFTTAQADALFLAANLFPSLESRPQADAVLTLLQAPPSA